MREIEAQDMKNRKDIEVNTRRRERKNNNTNLKVWKLRELQRIKRDREQREASKIKQAQIEVRRNMTDSEVVAEKTVDGQMGK